MTRKRVLFAVGFLFNILLPWAVYRLSEPRVGDAHAIMICAAVPTAWSLIRFARSRKVDMMSVIVLSGIALSLAALALGGSPKLLLFRESLITGAGGLVLLGSAIVGRPLLVVLMRAALSERSAIEAVVPGGVGARARAQLESYTGKAWFQRLIAATTVFFGLALIAETVVRGVLIFSMPTDRFLLVSPITRNGTAGVLLLWTFVYLLPAVRRNERADDARSERLDHN
jgi:hypothetical protein